MEKILAAIHRHSLELDDSEREAYWWTLPEVIWNEYFAWLEEIGFSFADL